MSPSPQPGVLTIMEQPTHNNLATSTTTVTAVTCAPLTALHSITTSTTTPSPPPLSKAPPTQAKLSMTIIPITATAQAAAVAVDSKKPQSIEIKATGVIEDNNNLTDKDIKEVVGDSGKCCNNNGEFHETTTITADDDDEDNNNDSYILDKPRKVLLSSVNPYITCGLCKGYLIDATTIVECLHSCKYTIQTRFVNNSFFCSRPVFI